MRSEGMTSRSGGVGGDVAYVLPLKARPIPQRKPDPPSPIQLKPIEGPPEPPKRPRKASMGRRKPGPKRGTASPLALDRSKVERLVELYESGMTAKDAGAAVGVARPTALKYLHAAGVEIRRQRGAVDIEVMKKMYLEDDLATKVIGEKLGVSGSTVLKHLKEAGVPMRPKSSKGRKKK